MPVSRATWSAVFCCVLLIVGCRGTSSNCPQSFVTATPEVISEGQNQTDLFVEVNNPFPDNGFAVVTELLSASGAIADPLARATTYACAHDVSGPVEICVNSSYSESGVADQTRSEVPSLGAAYEYIRRSHVQLPDPLNCFHTECAVVTCPEDKNDCPEVSSFTVEPLVLSDGETASITVVADDPDDNPDALVTTITARSGTVTNPNASVATYQCDPTVGGAIEICVVASDGDSSCDVEQCTSVRCPGDPDENTCPIIEDVTATPMTIPVGQTTSTIQVDATDPDDFPVPMRTELSATTGVFDDRFARNTTFRCGDSGPTEICVKANDGDPSCDEERCINVECPSDIPDDNVCPMLFVINAIPSRIPLGQTSTMVETRAQDTDGLPFPLTLTLSTLWGTLENTDNIQEPNNVVAQNATYICDRPGDTEVCVDATDGACTKTLCTIIECPADIAPPP